MPEKTEVQKVYKQVFKEGFNDAHSMYLNSLTDNGIFFIVQLIFIFGVLPFILLKNRNYLYNLGLVGGLLSYYTFGVVWPIWRHGWNPMLFWLLVSFVCCGIEFKSEDRYN